MPPPPLLPPGLGPSAGGLSPAAPAQSDRSGKEARGKIVAGLGLEMLRIAIPLLGNTEHGQATAEAVAKLGKKFVKPPEDIGQSELKFMQSQLYPAGPPAPPPAQGIPPAPAMPGALAA